MSTAQTAAPKPPTWTHTDSEGSAQLARALKVQSFRTHPDGSPMSTTDRVRLVRALCIATAYVVEDASSGAAGVPPRGEIGPLTLGSEVHGDLFRDRASCFAASTVARTWQVFAGPGRRMVYTAVTHDGAPPVLTEGGALSVIGDEAGFLPQLLLGAVVVVAIAAFAGALCYAAQAGAEVIDRKLTEDALTQRLLGTQAQALALLQDHTERERAAGRAIPWTPQEQQVLDGLLGVQRQIAAREHVPLPSPFMGAVKTAEKAVDKVAAGAGMGLGIAVVVGGALLWHSQKSQSKTSE